MHFKIIGLDSSVSSDQHGTVLGLFDHHVVCCVLIKFLSHCTIPPCPFLLVLFLSSLQSARGEWRGTSKRRSLSCLPDLSRRLISPYGIHFQPIPWSHLTVDVKVLCQNPEQGALNQTGTVSPKWHPCSLRSALLMIRALGAVIVPYRE